MDIIQQFPLPEEIQNLIRYKVQELYIKDRYNIGWIKINQIINNLKKNDFSLNLSEHLFDFELEFECVMRLPKLESIT
jgi:hypothetical protein